MPTGHYKRPTGRLNFGGVPDRVVNYLFKHKRGAEKSTTDICEDLGISSKQLAVGMATAVHCGIVLKRVESRMSYWSLPDSYQPKPARPMDHTPLTTHLRMLFEMIEESGAPISAPELALRYGCTYAHMMTLLRRLREKGLAAATSHGREAKWALKEVADAQRESDEAQKRRQKREARDGRRKQRLIEDTEKANTCWADTKPKQITVPAHQCLPMRPKAPASIFHLSHA